MKDDELIEQIKLTFPDYFYSQVADRKAKEIAELCKAHYKSKLLISIDEYSLDCATGNKFASIEGMQKAINKEFE